MKIRPCLIKGTVHPKMKILSLITSHSLVSFMSYENTFCVKENNNNDFI